jgi:hypothetical protein
VTKETALSEEAKQKLLSSLRFVVRRLKISVKPDMLNVPEGGCLRAQF